jgi:aminoglycoside 6'-N-acetyltransferase
VNITFKALTEAHFPLLLSWLEAPHVKAWWDSDVRWSLDLVVEKYSSYVEGYKLTDFHGVAFEKPIHPFVICINDSPIGYIQYYNAYDFPREYDLDLGIYNLPKHLASIDILIGELEWIGRGMASIIIDLFLKAYVFLNFDAVFLDLETANMRAIHVYEKAGFAKLKTVENGTITWMLKEKAPRV